MYLEYTFFEFFWEILEDFCRFLAMLPNRYLLYAKASIRQTLIA